MMLSPKEKEKSGILLELKIKERKETLDHAAEQALKQIEKRDMRQNFYKQKYLLF